MEAGGIDVRCEVSTIILTFAVRATCHLCYISLPLNASPIQIPPSIKFLTGGVISLIFHSSSLSTKGSNLSMKSSTLISSPCHCCFTPAISFGGISTLPTTWITPSLAIPSSIVTSENPLILMLMNRPKRKISTPKDFSSSAVWRSVYETRLVKCAHMA